MSGKPLIIAEKPSAARAIAEALGGFSRRENYMESPRYLLSWAIGHLVELKSPEEYDARYKRWALETLPILPPTFGLKVSTKTKAQFSLLAKLAKGAPELINACDAGREGELIFRYITQMAGVVAPVRRLWVSALTKEAIRKAFGELKPGTEYDRLYHSALCRSQGDWLVGMNATRAFTVKWGELFSVGRVQTPTLALLVKREREIAAFNSEPYWEVHAAFVTPDARSFAGKWFTKDTDRLKTEEDAQAVAARTKGQPGQVESVEEKPVSEKPPQLYDLTTLQREANRRFGLTAAATLKAAQSLYEDKLITYPRTDSRYITKDLARTMPGILTAVGRQPEYAQIAAGADPRLVHIGNRRIVDDAKVTDHHAILPTTEAPKSMGAAEAKIYGLIVRRFLAQFYPEARFLETEVITRVGALPDRFRSKGKRMLEQGWRVVEPEPKSRTAKDGEEEPAALPPLTAGEPVIARKVDVIKKETQPPKRYTEASLLSAMEFAGREMDDEALKEAMKGRGLGTPATRAAIIERLKDVGYISLSKKSLVPTPKGHGLVERAEAAGAQVLLSADLTGEWELKISQIQGGKYEPQRFMTEVRALAAQVVELTKGAPGGAVRRASPGAPGLAGGAPSTARRAAAAEAGAPGAPPAAGRPSPAPGGNAGRAPASGDQSPGELSEAPSAGACKSCGGLVMRTSRGWTCGTETCNLRIPTWLCSKVIDAALAADLLTKGKTRLISGFISPRTGKSFSAYLLLGEGQVSFEFPPNKGTRSGTKRGKSSERTTKTQTGSRKVGAAAARKQGSRGTGVS